MDQSVKKMACSTEGRIFPRHRGVGRGGESGKRRKRGKGWDGEREGGKEKLLWLLRILSEEVTYILGMVVFTCNCSTWQVEVGGL